MKRVANAILALRDELRLLTGEVRGLRRDLRDAQEGQRRPIGDERFEVQVTFDPSRGVWLAAGTRKQP